MGEDERGTDDIADLGGAGGDVLQGPPVAVSRANPRSPRQRRERWMALRVRVSISSSRPSGGCLTGICTPIVGAENLRHQAIFMNHAPHAVTPLNPELIQVGDAIG